MLSILVNDEAFALSLIVMSPVGLTITVIPSGATKLFSSEEVSDVTSEDTSSLEDSSEDASSLEASSEDASSLEDSSEDTSEETSSLEDSSEEVLSLTTGTKSSPVKMFFAIFVLF